MVYILYNFLQYKAGCPFAMSLSTATSIRCHIDDIGDIDLIKNIGSPLCDKISENDEFHGQKSGKIKTTFVALIMMQGTS